MIRLALYVACTLVVAAPACAQSVSERWGINATLGISPSTQDFVNEVALNEMLEVELSKLAEERAGAKIKEFAARMVKDHKETSRQLKALIRNGQVSVSFPDILDAARQATLDRLKGLQSGEFDKAFEALQISIHNDAVSLFERYGNGGDHRDLKVFAFKHLPHLQEHWRLARDLKR
ncbi:MAG: DUF4142 domain-containing protein [Proteobacteria bacterium]|nr:DUF4142 domain-containing protein [Pseudomonadota bacterium]